MTELVRSAAGRPTEQVVRRGAGQVADSSGVAQRRVARVVLRVLVRLLLALGLAVLALVFLEAWLPGVVLEVLGSLLPG